MSVITPYLFVPAIRERNLDKALGISLSGEAKIIFDFEDSVGDIDDLILSGELKAKARNILMEFFKRNQMKFLIRTNDVKSKFWEADKDFLVELSKILPMTSLCQGIVMSKTNTSEEIVTFLDWWKEKHAFSLPILPLIETVEGFKNLQEIAEIPEVVGLIFGHHDYFMDLSIAEDKTIFPVPRSPLTSQVYRDILNEFINVTNKCNKNLDLIDGVYSYLHDLDGIKDIGTYLFQLDSNVSWGKLVLNPKQFDALNELNESIDGVEIDLSSEDDVVNDEIKLQLALKLTSESTVHSDLKVTRIEGRYVSPQERTLAKKFIRESEI